MLPSSDSLRKSVCAHESCTAEIAGRFVDFPFAGVIRPKPVSTKPEDLLERLFGGEVRAAVISHALDISDVWKTANSASSNHKIWAAKFTARHPNLVAVEISSFKCGHDAPIYSVVEQIVERSGTPYFSFKDLDENRPENTIKLRVETID